MHYRLSVGQQSQLNIPNKIISLISDSSMMCARSIPTALTHKTHVPNVVFSREPPRGCCWPTAHSSSKVVRSVLPWSSGSAPRSECFEDFKRWLIDQASVAYLPAGCYMCVAFVKDANTLKDWFGWRARGRFTLRRSFLQRHP